MEPWHTSSPPLFGLSDGRLERESPGTQKKPHLHEKSKEKDSAGSQTTTTLAHRDLTFLAATQIPDPRFASKLVPTTCPTNKNGLTAWKRLTSLGHGRIHSCTLFCLGGSITDTAGPTRHHQSTHFSASKRSPFLSNLHREPLHAYDASSGLAGRDNSPFAYVSHIHIDTSTT